MPKSSAVLADELPYVNLWYFDNVLVHSSECITLR